MEKCKNLLVMKSVSFTITIYTTHLSTSVLLVLGNKLYSTITLTERNDNETSYSNPEYDINVSTDKSDTYVNLTFYPLRYPGDAGYNAELMFNSTTDLGLPLADYSTWYTLTIPKKVRGPRSREALQYLEKLVNEDSCGDEWDLEGMDWTSIEGVLTEAPTLIAEFMAKLPRRGQLKAGDN
jgi:hypothetical protein